MWTKVVAPTVLVSVIWVLFSCGTSYVVNRVDETQTLLLNQNRSLMQADGAMQKNLWRLQTVLFDAAERETKDGVLREHFQQQAKKLEDAFELALARAGENASTDEEKTLVRTIGKEFDRYQAASTEQLARGDLSPEEIRGSLKAAMKSATTVADSCDRLSDLGQRLANETFQLRDRMRAKVNMARIAFIIVGPAIGILLGLWVARGLNYSISEISVTLRDAGGDLEQEIGLVEVSPSDSSGGLSELQQHVQYISGRIKQVVEELHWTRREAVRSERLAAVGELAAGVAHEVRNPLTSVKLLIQAIERNQSPNSGDRQRLQIVQQEIARIETTMQELLDYARPPKLRRLRHDVRETLRRSLNLAAARAKQSEIAIDERLGNSPRIVDADPEQLQQVFVNLLLNGIEATPAGGALHVAIEGPTDFGDVASGENGPNGAGSNGPRANGSGAAMAGAPTNRLLRIVFRDTGSGIRADVMERLFQPFVTGKERGIGLGLAISRQIVQEHGGRLTACNPPPCGAMFVVEVPLADAAAPDAATRVAVDDLADAGRAAEKSCAEAIETVNH